MSRRRINDILELIAEYRAQHGQRFPTARSPFPRGGDSWNAIDSALRRGAIVQCLRYTQIKTALAQRGLTPTLARLDPAYVPPRTRRRRFADILEMVERSTVRHGRFPLRGARFDLPGFDDSWIAIDSALADGAIAPCPLWAEHCAKMERLGVSASLASLNPRYRPFRRQHRSIAAIKSAIVEHMGRNGGRMPNQRAAYPGGRRSDSWKAVCKALSSGAIAQDADRAELAARLAVKGQKPSLYTLIDCYRDELRAAYALAWPQPAAPAQRAGAALHPARAARKPAQFAALVSQLFRSPAPRDVN